MVRSEEFFDDGRGGGDSTNGENVDYQLNVKRLKSMRETVNWKKTRERYEFLNQLDPLIINWRGQLPDLREIFRPEEIDRLLIDSVRNSRYPYHPDASERFIRFVARSDFKDEPNVIINGKPSSRRTTPLHHAVGQRLRNSNIVFSDLFKIYARFDVNYTAESGLTHFHVACARGCYSVVGKFLELGQDPDCLAQKSVDPPLHMALKNGDAKMFELLLRKKADPNLVSTEGYTPLQFICRTRQDIFATMLFEICDDIGQTVQVNVQDKVGRTPLHLAMEYGRGLQNELLLRRGANPNLADEDGETPVHTMCQCYVGNFDELVEKFFRITDEIQQTVDIDARNKFGITPMHLALLSNHKAAFKILLRRGASPNLADVEGSTPLHTLCRRTHEDDELVAFLKILFEINKDQNLRVQVDARDMWGRTPLELALYYRMKFTTKVLIKNGADPNLANADGFTPLHIISRREYDDDLMEEFFEICEDNRKTLQIDVQDKLGRTPLQWAVVGFKLHIVEVLLNRGASMPRFVFLTKNYFGKRLVQEPTESMHDFKLRLAAGVIAIVKQLEKRGYELDRIDVLTVMDFFVEYELFEQSSSDSNWWYNNQEFVTEAKNILIRFNPDLPLYDLTRLRPEQAAKKLTLADYFALSRSKKLDSLPESHRDPCALHLCEKLSRRFFLHYAMYSFFELRSYQLPILCCESIVEKLKNEDLHRIYLADAIGRADGNKHIVNILQRLM